jgi:cytoskeletal protein CcmA (bactofilin family)
MNVPWTTLLFFLITAAVLLLPLVPGMREIRSRRDTQALTVSAESRVDVRHFADGFRRVVDIQLKELLQQCEQLSATVGGELVGGEPYVLLSGAAPFEPRPQEHASGRCERIVASAGDLRVPEGMDFAREVYAGGSLHGGPGCRYRAVLTEYDLRLAAGSTSLRWVHAGGVLHVEPGCALYGRVSADISILVEGPCRFERMRAPVIELRERSYQEGWRDGRVPLTEVDAATLPCFSNLSAGRALVEGDVEIPPDSVVAFDLVAWGSVRIGQGTHVRGSIKAHRDLVLESGCRVDGSVISQRSIVIADGCYVHGPLLSESRVTIGTRGQFGRAIQPTTVRAPRIEVRLDTVVHGTLWASDVGKVIA